MQQLSWTDFAGTEGTVYRVDVEDGEVALTLETAAELPSAGRAEGSFRLEFRGPTDPVLRKSLLLAGIHYTEGILWLVTVSIVLDRTRRFFLRSALRRWLDGLCGTVFIGLGARLALER